MITNKDKTPANVFIKEDVIEQVYETYADDTVDGVVKYVREDYIPNEEEMLALAEKQTYWIDDRFCPYDRKELRSRSWLEGYRFAKEHQEIKVRNVYKYVQEHYDDETQKPIKPKTKYYKEEIKGDPFVDKLIHDISDRLKEVYGEELPQPLKNQLPYIVSQVFQATEKKLNEPKQCRDKCLIK